MAEDLLKLAEEAEAHAAKLASADEAAETTRRATRVVHHLRDSAEHLEAAGTALRGGRNGHQVRTEDRELAGASK
jgi:hypothetical protein